jgi:hypothetical protein
MNATIFECVECHRVPNCPMLHDSVWLPIADKKDLLCVVCAEKRLGRKITLADLLPCVGNDWGVIIAKRAVPTLNISDYVAAHRVERAIA